MQTLNLCLLNGVPICEQLALEEALVRTHHENFCIFNCGAPPAIVMGISSKTADHIDSAAFGKTPLPIIRRFSGGGTVVVDENTLFVSFLLQRPGFSPDALMHEVEALLKPVFAPHDFHLQERDFVIGEKKIGGNAQYITKNSALHHSTFLWDFDPERMALLKMPPKMPSYRHARSHEEFCGTLETLFPSKEAFRDKLTAVLKDKFVLTIIPAENLFPLTLGPHRKATQHVLFERYL
jgi:lipoate-protein ligase A